MKMAYTSGCGMKALRELENFLDSKGISYFVKDTADHLWPYRKPRITTDNLKYIVVVWAGKRGIRDDWRFLAVQGKNGVNYEELESEMKNMRAYPYIRNIQ